MANEQITPEQIMAVLKQQMGQVNNMMQTQQATPAAQNGSFMPAVQQPQQQVAGGGTNPTGWSVPIEFDLGGAAVTIYVQFPAHTFPQFQQIVADLMSRGYQVRAFQKNNGYGGNSSGFNRGGSYGGGFNRGGGYGRGGYGGRY